MVAALLALLLVSPACAQGLRYRLEIEAPRDLARILRQGLTLSRWQNDAQMTPGELRRLSDDAVREAREAAATEGYFSAEADVRVEETDPEWKVILHVVPGPRTRVAEIDIRFTGPAASDPEAHALFKRVRGGWRLRRGGGLFYRCSWD